MLDLIADRAGTGRGSRLAHAAPVAALSAEIDLKLASLVLILLDQHARGEAGATFPRTRVERPRDTPPGTKKPWPEQVL